MLCIASVYGRCTKSKLNYCSVTVYPIAVMAEVNKMCTQGGKKNFGHPSNPSIYTNLTLVAEFWHEPIKKELS